MTNNKEERVYCPTCGDVTDGHPAMDDIAKEMLENGAKTHYVKPQEEKAIPKEDMDKTLKQLHAEGKSIRLEPQEEKWYDKEDIKKWAEEKIAYYKTRKDDATSNKEFCGAVVYILDDLLKYLD